MTLADEFGAIDIYLFDQLLRGRITPGMRVLDAGCGGGRNLTYLLRQGYDVCANDADPAAVAAVRALGAELAPPDRQPDVRAETVEHTSFPEAHVDVVVASAVLHFARDTAHFDAMLDALWRVLRPGGLFFARLASRAGIEHDVQALGNGRFRLPDGSDRYLVDVAQLERATRQRGGVLVDPLKTTLVHGQRSMTTWVLRKGPA